MNLKKKRDEKQKKGMKIIVIQKTKGPVDGALLKIIRGFLRILYFYKNSQKINYEQPIEVPQFKHL